MADFDVVIDLADFAATTDPDPSGGTGHVCQCTLTPDEITVHKDHPKTILFSFSNIPAGKTAVITDFRYKNGDDNLWYRPKKDPAGNWEGRDGKEFAWKELADDGSTLLIRDRATNKVDYHYVVEMEIDGGVYVNDPQIHNRE